MPGQFLPRRRLIGLGAAALASPLRLALPAWGLSRKPLEGRSRTATARCCRSGPGTAVVFTWARRAGAQRPGLAVARALVAGGVRRPTRRPPYGDAEALVRWRYLADTGPRARAVRRHQARADSRRATRARGVGAIVPRGSRPTRSTRRSSTTCAIPTRTWAASMR